jgi:hypothetical protein
MDDVVAKWLREIQKWTQSFCNSKLNYFVTHSQDFLLSHFARLDLVIFVIVLSHFLIVTGLNHFHVIRCSTIPPYHNAQSFLVLSCCSAQPFSTTKVFSVILRYYSNQSTELSHSSLLQCVRLLSHFAKWPSSVTVTGGQEASSRLVRGREASSQLGRGRGRERASRPWACGSAGLSRPHGAPSSGALARSDLSGLIQVMNNSAIYIYNSDIHHFGDDLPLKNV